MVKYPNEHHQLLIKVFSQLESNTEIKNFLRDLCTLQELDEFSQRFQIAKLLWTTNLSYAKIANQVGTSTTTVTRVSHWLYKMDFQGYAAVLQKIYGQSQRKGKF